MAITTNKEPKWKIVDSKGNIIDTYFLKYSAMVEASRLNEDMFGEKFKVEKIEKLEE